MTGNRWSAVNVVSGLLREADGVRDKASVLLYFAARFRVGAVRPLRWLAPPPRLMSWRSTPYPLFVSVESGGLSVWYETSVLPAYSLTPDFMPLPGWTVVDVGANIGAYTLWAAGQLGSSGRLIAIEPNPISYRHLERSIRGLPIAVSAHQIACGDSEGHQTLHFEKGYTVSSSLFGFDEASEHVSVSVNRLDEIVRLAGVEHIDILKIDVEGAEELVLRGASRILDSTDRVILETTAGELGASVRSLMASRGFVEAGFEGDHWAVPGLELVGFLRPEVARS